MAGAAGVSPAPEVAFLDSEPAAPAHLQMVFGQSLVAQVIEH